MGGIHQLLHGSVLEGDYQSVCAAVAPGVNDFIRRFASQWVREVRCGAGVSLSSGTRSAIAINPENPQAETLRAWWDSEGRSSALTPISNENR